METKIFKNYEDFLRREDKSINGVTLAFLEENKINLDSLNLDRSFTGSVICPFGEMVIK